MSQFVDNARRALRGALEVRRNAGVAPDAPICIYDLAETLGIDVRFLGGSSFGGMFSKTTQTILVPAQRPMGRQAFTCAHELGHWYFDHGDQIDEIDIDFEAKSEKERLANSFASCLIMPQWAIQTLLNRRGWTIEDLDPIKILMIASQLGVGYDTLILHLKWGLNLISGQVAETLLLTTPKKLKKNLLGFDYSGHLVVVDLMWEKVAIDLQIGDIAIVPKGVKIEGQGIKLIGDVNAGSLVQGIQQGISKIVSQENPWCSYVRVSKKGYEGRSIFRHLEDNDA